MTLIHAIIIVALLDTCHVHEAHVPFYDYTVRQYVCGPVEYGGFAFRADNPDSVAATDPCYITVRYDIESLDVLCWFGPDLVLLTWTKWDLNRDGECGLTDFTILGEGYQAIYFLPELAAFGLAYNRPAMVEIGPVIVGYLYLRIMDSTPSGPAQVTIQLFSNKPRPSWGAIRAIMQTEGGE